MKKIITTVGTSLFTNYMKEEVRESEEFDYGNHYNEPIDGRGGLFRKLETVNHTIFEINNNDINKLKDIIKRRWLNKFRRDASAEISSLLKIAEDDDIEVYLLATETLLSSLACEILKEYLESENNELRDKFKNIHFDKSHIIKGLQVQDAGKFQDEGFINLVEKIVSIKNDYKDTILNISGGYKALIPPLTLLAQLEDIPLFYIYEDSNTPIETGVLPIHFDWGFIEDYVVLLNNDKKRASASDSDILTLRERKLIYPNSRDLTILGQLMKRYSNTSSPFTSTIFGYFIEHKIFECYINKYGPENVEHSVKYEGMGTEDIDILITSDNEKIIPVEIKPSYVLDSEDRMNDIAEKLIKRTNFAIEKGGKQKPSEIWLITYSYTDIKPIPSKILSDNEKKNAMSISAQIKNAFPDDCSFCIKHFFIEQNKLNGERHIYQRFMKSSLKSDQIKDIFNSH